MVGRRQPRPTAHAPGHHGSRGGWSELSLGHIIAHSGPVAQATPSAAPGWAKASTATPTAGPSCAGQGLLLSTNARGNKGSVQSTQMDATEAVAQLKAAQQLGLP